MPFNIMDSFNSPEFQDFQNNIAKSVDLAIITTDYTGTPVTKHSNCTKFCKMVRDNPYYRTLCERCDSRGGLEAARTRTPYIYICHSNIVDFAIPIIFNNAYLGAIMAGQVLLNDNKDISGLEQIYMDNSTAPLKSGAFFEAYQSLPVMNFEKIVSISNMLFYVCNMHLEKNSVNVFSSFEPESSDYRQKETNAPYLNRNILTPVYQFIDENIFGDLSLNYVASACNISPNYLSRLFSKENKISFTSYVNNKKIKYSKRLLVSTDMSIKEISSKLGYNDCSYFIKIFKNFAQTSPAKYRAVGEQTQDEF